MTECRRHICLLLADAGVPRFGHGLSCAARKAIPFQNSKFKRSDTARAVVGAWGYKS